MCTKTENGVRQNKKKRRANTPSWKGHSGIWNFDQKTTPKNRKKHETFNGSQGSKQAKSEQAFQ